MPKSKLSKMFRLVNKLEDGRKVYLSVDGKIVIMAKFEAEFWLKVGLATQGIMVDGFVYSKDLREYGRRSYWLERLQPFAQVVGMEIEQADAPVDPEAYIVGGLPATSVGYWTKPRDEFQHPILVIC
jgi:hypothetical protein